MTKLNKQIIISLNGQEGSGKSTISKILEEKYPFITRKAKNNLRGIRGIKFNE